MKIQKKIKLLSEFKKKKCKYCKSTENLTIDHKVPLIKGGKNELSNLQCLCKRCNGIKSGLSHKQVMNLFRWFMQINESRIQHGKKPYYLTTPSK